MEGCTKVTSQVLDSVDGVNDELTFWVLRDDDFLDETRPYLVFLSRSSKSMSSKCLKEEGVFYVKGIVQSMFPVMELDFCNLEKICDFLVQRQSIFHSEINSEEKIIKYFTFESKRIYATVTANNLKQKINSINRDKARRLNAVSWVKSAVTR